MKRHAEVRAAAERVVNQWRQEDEHERNDLSAEFWSAMAELASALAAGEP